MGTAEGTMAVSNERYVDAQREICGCAARDMWMRSERYVVRSGVVGTAGVRDGVRSGMAMRAAVG